MMYVLATNNPDRDQIDELALDSGQAIEHCRKTANITQDQLCNACGITVVTYRKLIKGRCKLTTLLSIMTALSVEFRPGFSVSFVGLTGSILKAAKGLKKAPDTEPNDRSEDLKNGESDYDDNQSSGSEW